MAEAESPRAIVAALGANLGIAVAKFVGFAVTGSSSMLAEGVHSVADTGNQGLLLLGRRQAERDADREHPFGHGRERFFFAFVVALMIFTLGGVFALVEGVEKLSAPEALSSPAVAVAILLAAVALEGYSFRTAYREARELRGPRTWWQFVRRTVNPELPIVLLEDSAALVGLVLALAGVTLTLLTGDAVWDAVATLAIGVLLVVVALILMVETKSLLIGEGAEGRTVRAVSAALTGGEVARVIHLRTQWLGPEELLVAAKIAVPARLSTARVAAAIDAAEARLRAAVPEARVVYLEPDLDRTGSDAGLDEALDPTPAPD